MNSTKINHAKTHFNRIVAKIQELEARTANIHTQAEIERKEDIIANAYWTLDTTVNNGPGVEGYYCASDKAYWSSFNRDEAAMVMAHIEAII